MQTLFDGCRNILWGLAQAVPPRRHERDTARREMRQILAVVPPGPNRVRLQALSKDAGWTLRLKEAIPAVSPGREADLPGIVIFDRELSPGDWRQAVSVLAKSVPRPYVILLSPTADHNLVAEFRRVGGSDVLRTPLNPEELTGALNRAWLFSQSQQHVRDR